MENVRVTDHSFADWESKKNIALSWEHEDARYHLWERDPDILYKNPPLKNDGTARGPYDPGYFRARKLDARTRKNAVMIAQARRIAEEQGLYAKATRDKTEQLQAEKDSRNARIALNRKREAAEALYDACRAVVDWFATRDPETGSAEETIFYRVRDALGQADTGAAGLPAPAQPVETVPESQP